MSSNPTNRLKAHNSGKVRSTKARRPYSILIIEDFDDKISARRREKYYKTGFGKKVWMKKINNGSGFPARSPAGTLFGGLDLKSSDPSLWCRDNKVPARLFFGGVEEI